MSLFSFNLKIVAFEIINNNGEYNAPLSHIFWKFVYLYLVKET